MSEEGGLKECSFFVVRYVPDLVRDEAINIGLFLYSPREKYLGCLFTDNFRRIKRFHPQADLEFLRELQEDFEHQVEEHESRLDDYLRELQETLSNLIQLTPPRICRLADPQTEIEELFGRYVGTRVSGPPPQDARLRVKQRLTAAFVRAGVWDRLEKRIPTAHWTHPGDTFTFDYGYRPLVVEGQPNGHLKFVHALSLKRDKELAHVLANTIRYVRKVEPAELTAVIEGLPLPGDEAAMHSQHVLEDALIALQPLAGVDDYAQSVRRELMM